MILWDSNSKKNRVIFHTITTWRPLTDTNHSENFLNKWSFFFFFFFLKFKVTSLHGDQRHLKPAIVKLKFLQILKIEKKKGQRGLVTRLWYQHHISADWISLSFIFFFQNIWKKKFFFYDTWIFFYHIGHLAILQFLPYLGKNGLKLNLEFKSSGVTSLWILSS